MMKWTQSFGCAEGDGHHAVELPYRGRGVSMATLLLAARHFEESEDSLNAGPVDAITKKLALDRVALAIAGFELESGFSVTDTLAGMGVLHRLLGGRGLLGYEEQPRPAHRSGGPRSVRVRE